MGETRLCLLSGWGRLVPPNQCHIHGLGEPLLKSTTASAFGAQEMLVDMKSAAASKGHLAREEQWCDSEHVAALVLPKAKVLIRFSQLTNCISSVCCPP